MNKLTKTIVLTIAIILGILILSIIVFTIITPKEAVVDNYQYGLDNYNKQNYSKALQYLNKNLQTSPDDTNSLLLVLDIYLFKNKIVDSLALADKYLSKDTISPENKIKIIEKLLTQLNQKELSKYLLLLNNYRALTNEENETLILSLLANKEKDKAYQLIKDTYTNLDKNSESANNISFLWLLLNLDPDQVDRSKQVLKLLNQSLISKDKIDEVQKIYNAISDDSEKNSKLTHQLNIISLLSKYDLDMWVYTNFPNIESDVENYDLGNMILGIVQYKIGDYKKSIDLLNKALSLNGDLPLANLYLAKNYISQGAAIQTVIENYKKTLSLNDVSTHHEFAEYLCMQTLYQQCIEEYQSLLEQDASQNTMDNYVQDSFRLITVILDNNLQLSLIPNILSNLQNKYTLIPSTKADINQQFAELNIRYVYMDRMLALDSSDDKKVYLTSLQSDLDTIAQKFALTKENSLLFSTVSEIIKKRLYELYEESKLSKTDRDVKRTIFVDFFNDIIDKDNKGIATKFAKGEL